MADDFDVGGWAARLAEHKREAEESVAKLVTFIRHLEATLATAREALAGIAAVVAVDRAPPATPPAPSAPAEAPGPSAQRKPAAPAGPTIPDALWVRVQEIEANGAGEILSPEANALGVPSADGGNEYLVNALFMRGWTLHPSADGMVYNRVAAQQTLANRKAALAARGVET